MGTYLVGERGPEMFTLTNGFRTFRGTKTDTGWHFAFDDEEGADDE